MRGITTADRARFNATGALPVSRRDKIAGIATAILFLAVPIAAPFLPGGMWA